VAAVFSTQLFALAGVTGLNPNVFTVPIGRVAVVRSIVLTLGSTLLAGDIQVLGAFGEVIATLARSPAPGGPETQVTNMRLVYNAGDSLSVVTHGGFIGDASCGGYILTTP
jgi:hypothetical protein